MGYSLEGRKELDMTKRLHFTTYLLEWLKSRALTPPNVNEDVEHRNSRLLLAAMNNGTATLEDSWVFPH